jgi:hypothetical protein
VPGTGSRERASGEISTSLLWVDPPRGDEIAFSHEADAVDMTVPPFCDGRGGASCRGVGPIGDESEGARQNHSLGAPTAGPDRDHGRP